MKRMNMFIVAAIFAMGMAVTSASAHKGEHMNPCNPCAMKHNPCNPCAMKDMKKHNPCAMKHQMKDHNPCSMKVNPCNAHKKSW
ncbi:MAG: hypothetical protein R8K50_11395 [Mariprofundus sp.]